MRVKNVRPYALVIGVTDQVVEPGDEVEVDAELGASLLDQPDNWEAASAADKAAAPKAEKAAAARAKREAKAAETEAVPADDNPAEADDNDHDRNTLRT